MKHERIKKLYPIKSYIKDYQQSPNPFYESNTSLFFESKRTKELLEEIKYNCESPTYAVKMLKIHPTQNYYQIYAQKENHIEHERKILQKNIHPAIIQILDYFPKSKNHLPLNIIPFYSRGSLDKQNGDLSNLIKMKLILGTISAIQFLHSRNIVHGQISPHHILLTYDYNPLLIDFSKSQIILQETHINNQITDFNSNDLFAEDIKNFGLLCNSLLDDKYLRSDNSNGFSILVNQCLNQNPKNRPNATTIFSSIIKCQEQTGKVETNNFYINPIFLIEHLDSNELENLNLYLKEILTVDVLEMCYLINQKRSEMIEKSSFLEQTEINPTEIQENIQNIQKEIEKCQVVIQQNEKIDTFSKKMNKEINNSRKNGILFTLNFLDPSKIILSQSSNDIYNILNINSNDGFLIEGKDSEGFIEFKFPFSFVLTEFTLTNHSFPKYCINSFILKSKTQELLNIENDPELTYPNSSKTFYIETDKYSQNSIPFDASDTYYFIKKTSKPSLIRNVKFNNFFTQYQNQRQFIDPKSSKSQFMNDEEITLDFHKLNVKLSSNAYSFDLFLNPEKSSTICTFKSKMENNYQWFQIELIDYSVFIEKYYIKLVGDSMMNDFHFYGSADGIKWIFIGQHQLLDLESVFVAHSNITLYPLKYFRLLNRDKVVFSRFEVYGRILAQ
ncbi:hypothetical protein TRFO_23678 [Tritrichomonas foetus]|uniref:Protein kinase domain-containing protein n=1 Tax=Tritrichomonas foetus TaxID=1144522 RepID=A0A1J4KAI4_9EUKA|nr:hypothetical protein TRFO_23678 [Tritrichomonas foetus]|eukprot:OHT07978.1 hypothetical protein TRFO_23678 [Tritrichomonas foetus]